MRMRRGVGTGSPVKKSKRLLATATLLLVICAALLSAVAPRAFGWSDDDFEHRPLVAYPVPPGHDNIIGEILTYKIKKGDTLLDVGRYYDLSGKEVSDANGHMDWW